MKCFFLMSFLLSSYAFGHDAREAREITCDIKERVVIDSANGQVLAEYTNAELVKINENSKLIERTSSVDMGRLLNSVTDSVPGFTPEETKELLALTFNKTVEQGENHIRGKNKVRVFPPTSGFLGWGAHGNWDKGEARIELYSGPNLFTRQSAAKMDLAHAVFREYPDTDKLSNEQRERFLSWEGSEQFTVKTEVVVECKNTEKGVSFLDTVHSVEEVKVDDTSRSNTKPGSLRQSIDKAIDSMKTTIK